MLQSSTYLLVNFFMVIICFSASFNKKIQFYKHFGTFLLSSTIVAVPFIVCDIWFTDMDVWRFNTDYTIGVIIAGLPIEEWLFFYSIPFAFVFTYYGLDRFFDLSWTHVFNNVIVFVTTIVCVVTVLLYYDRLYTFTAAVITLVTMAYLHFIAKKEWIGQAFFVFVILMIGFFAVNGLLTVTGTGASMVNYNREHLLDIRMFNIPVEAVVYGFSQFMLNIYFFDLLKKKNL